MHNKINFFSGTLILSLGFLIQLTLLDHIKVLNAKPDILLSLVVFFALFLGPPAGFLSGFISGFLKDIFSTGVFGSHTFMLALTGLAVGILSPKLFKESKLTQATLVFVSAVLYMMALYYIAVFFSGMAAMNIYGYLLGLIIPTAIYTSLVSAFIYPILIRRYRLKEDKEYL